ncbi:zinc finger, CCHC-type containing protein [Tanacetum coccineum]
MDSIMGNNTWVLADLPPGCKPLGCKWIFKRKLKVDGTVKKFKAKLVIQGFKQKSRIDYFDTYAPVARISTIRLLIVMASIHSLIIHQMDMKTSFLNEELEEEVYLNQPLGFILPGNENKVCKLVKSLYELKQAPKQWHQKFDEVVLLMVDLTKEFLSSRFSMKDIGEADIILGIRIKHESNRIAISQSHYIEKVLKKFNYSDCTPVSTPMDTCEKLMPNKGQAVSQLEYSTVIQNPGTQLCQANFREYSILKKTKQTCITGSTMESKFMALAATSKEADWLKSLLLEIPLWVKPMSPISICCDSVATLAKLIARCIIGSPDT